MRGYLLVMLFAAIASPAFSESNQAPPECRYDAAGQVDYEACLAAAPEGSPWRSLSLMNLGTRAYVNADFAAAVRYYDAAQPPDGHQMYSDAAYHAYYSATLYQVGRTGDALVQARRALAVLRAAPEVPEEVRRRFSSHPVDHEVIYASILPVLHGAGDAETENVMAAYMALPARDWVSWANRAAVFLEIGNLEAALEANGHALQLQGEHPAVLNNQCYILTSLLRAEEGLPYCEGAVRRAPNVAAIRHSMASALSALGRCAEAERELAEARRLDPVTLEYQQTLTCEAG